MSRLRLVVQCAAMAVNALCAGGVYSFPLVSPALVEHLRFNQSQLTTIALAGMVGQYPFAALVGKVLDSHGARICSLIAAMSFSIGFGLFAGEIAGAPDVMPKESVTSAFRRMVVYFALVGLGTVFSYFSVLFSATKLFPRYVGIASGTSMALFGCSPLIISAVADKFFTFTTPEPSPFTRPPSSLDAAEDGARQLNVTQFLTFLAILTGITHILGSLVLPGPAPQHDVPSTDGYDALDCASVPDIVTVVEEVTAPSWDDSDETAPLLSRAKGKTQVIVEVVEAAEVPPPQHGSALDLVKDPYFWVLAGVTAVVLGCSEMVIANMGSLFLSLPATPISAGLLFNATTAARGTTIARQVQLLSLTNTLSRLVIGPLADWAAPVPISMVRNGSSTPSSIGQDPEHAAASQGASSKTYYVFPRAHYVSRVAFMLAASILLMFTFLAFLSVNGSMSVEDVKAFAGRNSMNFLSIGVGVAYGSAFTVLPGIIASIYGAANLGRNFGIISYAPFVGTSAFSYLYAVVVDANSSKPQGGTTDADAATCRGSQCWRTTFAAAIAALGVAAFASMLLWRRWRGRV